MQKNYTGGVIKPMHSDHLLNPMASYISSSYYFTRFLLFLISFLTFTLSDAQPFSSSRPQGVALPFHRDPSTLQLVTEISLGTPRVPISLVLDLGGAFPWIHCGHKLDSSSYQPVDRKSPQCSLASKFVQIPQQCCNKTCSISSTNPIIRSTSSGQLGSDVVTVHSGYEPGQRPYLWYQGENVTARRFAFGCAATSDVLNGLAKGVHGMAGLGRSSGLSLVSQFAVAFRFSRKFALDFRFGNVYFGGGHYIEERLRPSLIYTPLVTNPYNPQDYYIGVKSIQIDGVNVTIPKKMLSIDKKSGAGGTKFSTAFPYTSLHTSIFKAFASLYVKRAKAMNITRVASTAPFRACFNSSTMVDKYLDGGLVVPQISLVLTNNVVLRVVGSRCSLKRVADDVLCLGFVDGGLKAKSSIVIGGHQLQDNLFEFDIPRSRLGFSQPLIQSIAPIN